MKRVSDDDAGRGWENYSTWPIAGAESLLGALPEDKRGRDGDGALKQSAGAVANDKAEVLRSYVK